MAWENAKQIFRGQPIQLPNNKGIIMPEDLPNSNINSISINLIKPVRDQMVEYILKITYYRDNSVVKEYSYTVYPSECIDGIPMFNTFGCKIYQDMEGTVSI